jgi:hypothetical protein
MFYENPAIPWAIVITKIRTHLIETCKFPNCKVDDVFEQKEALFEKIKEHLPSLTLEKLEELMKIGYQICVSERSENVY